jgi:hypothetical protein
MRNCSQTAARHRLILCIVLLGFLLQGASCPDVQRAKDAVVDNIESVLDQLGPRPRSWRVHFKVLDKGTEVSTYEFNEAEQPSYTCRGWCVLFFLDLDHLAHFAHPTRVFVYDSKASDRSQPVTVLPESEWWPTIREPGWAHPLSIFNTVASRNDPSEVFKTGIAGEMPPPIVRDRVLGLRLASGRPVGHAMIGPVEPEPAPPSDVEPSPVPLPTPGVAPECDSTLLPVWAILVNGYHDESDTFDDDLVGAYSMLNGQGVSDERIVCLSPFQLAGVKTCVKNSESDLISAVGTFKNELSACATAHPDWNPQLLLFWSSHGSDNALACNLADGSQDVIHASTLNTLVSQLEAGWTGVNDLEVTVVIEACKSGTVGQQLHLGGASRKILTSARADDLSYRDVDEETNGKQDPNPADSGSETIWGYVEAYGSAESDADGDGLISFQEAVDYAMATDVTYKDPAGSGSDPGLHEIGVWNPLPDGPVHGAWNASARVSSSLAFTAPASTIGAVAGVPVSVKVLRCRTSKIEIEAVNLESAPEVGALALRVFRNNEQSPGEWEAIFYPADNVRTTFMVPGFESQETAKLGYELYVPPSYHKGDQIRIVATLDSGQMFAPTALMVPPQQAPKTEISLEVKEKFFVNLGCWWKGLWD